MSQNLKEILTKFNESTLEQQKSLNEKHHLKDMFTRDEIIKGCLEFGEISLLYNIFELMERDNLGTDNIFEYDWVVTISNEQGWSKREENWRFFEILKGHVSALEFDVFWNTYEILYQFTTFTGLENLILYIYGGFPNLGALKLESVTSLSIVFRGESESVLEKIIKVFPNLTYVSISDGKDIKEWDVFKNLENFKDLILLRTYIREEVKKELTEKGINVY